MKTVLFTNLPWWESAPDRSVRMGVRSGSRWGHTFRCMSLPDHFAFGDYRPYPIYLGFAASYAAANTTAKVRLRDSVAMADSYSTFGQYLAHLQPDIVIVESTTPSWEHDRKLIPKIHQALPLARLVVAGTIVTTRAQEALALPGVDAVIEGEFEKGSVQAIEGAHGLIRRQLLTREEMNAAPFPYYDEWMARRYCDHNPAGQIFPHAHLWSSRGCAFKCRHCEWPATMTGDDPDGTGKRTVRQYSAEYLEGLVRDLIARFQLKSIYWDDDTMNLGNRHVAKVCEVMAKIGIPWSAMCRIDTCDRDHWKLMAKSGCFGVKIGYESGSQFVVDQLINKGIDLEAARDTTFFLRSIGMTVHGTFMSGMPGETKEHMRQTLDYIRSLPLTSVQHSGVAELEGAPLHTLREEGKMQDANYTRENDGARAIERIVQELAAEKS